MKNDIFGLLILIISLYGCGQAPIVETNDPKINQVSTFDVSLDREAQNQLESQFDLIDLIDKYCV